MWLRFDLWLLRQECVGVAKLLFWSHLVSFSLIPIVYAGRGCEVFAFAGTTEEFA